MAHLRLAHGWRAWGRAALVTLCALPLLAHAGLNEGLQAFHAGKYEQARAAIAEAAEAGNPLAQRYLSHYYMVRSGAPWNDPSGLKKAQRLRWISRAANGGDLEALALLAEFYGREGEAGRASPAECARALEAGKQAAQAGWPRAYLALGHLFAWDGCFRQDVAQAVNWLTQGAELGDPLAQGALCDLGILQAEENVRSRLGLANVWCLAAAKRGHAGSMLELVHLNMGEGDHPKDFVAALFWAKVALAQSKEGLPALDVMGLDGHMRVELETLSYKLFTYLDPDQRELVDRRVAAFKRDTGWDEVTTAQIQKELAAAASHDARQGERAAGQAQDSRDVKP